MLSRVMLIEKLYISLHEEKKNELLVGNIDEKETNKKINFIFYQKEIS